MHRFRCKWLYLIRVISQMKKVRKLIKQNDTKENEYDFILMMAYSHEWEEIDNSLMLIKLERWRRKWSRTMVLWRNGKPRCKSRKRHDHMQIEWSRYDSKLMYHEIPENQMKMSQAIYSLYPIIQSTLKILRQLKGILKWRMYPWIEPN